jgi:hypothetical protein
MTAEIVIGNGFGVVLCADTATTRRGERTYDGARKLIGLPLPHRIGVLHAGMVTFHGLPFETLVENWLHGLPNQRLPRIADYAESFSDYLCEAVPTYMSEVDIARDYLHDWRHRLLRTADYLKDTDSFNEQSIHQYFTDLIDEYNQEDIKRGERFAAKVFEALGAGSRRNPLEAECVEYGCPDLSHSSLEGIAHIFFGEVASPETLDLIARWMKLFSGLHHPCDSSSMATIVLAGYADRDALPTLVQIDIEAFAFGRLFSFTRATKHANRQGAGFVLLETFGQSDEIHRFIREAGLSPHYHQEVVKNSFSQFSQIDSHAVENSGPEMTSDVDDNSNGPDGHMSRLGEEISHELEQVAERNTGTALSSLSSMNLKNLATMAERLVSLQNLALDLRGELPTVGAELVTATVTLQHGFSFNSRIAGESNGGSYQH